MKTLDSSLPRDSSVITLLPFLPGNEVDIMQIVCYGLHRILLDLATQEELGLIMFYSIRLAYFFLRLS